MTRFQNEICKLVLLKSQFWIFWHYQNLSTEGSHGDSVGIHPIINLEVEGQSPKLSNVGTGICPSMKCLCVFEIVTGVTLNPNTCTLLLPNNKLK